MQQITEKSLYGLQWQDYLIIACCLSISALIGVFFAIKDSQIKDLNNYLMGGRSMKTLPVALSLTASFISALTILGGPAEYYTYGTMFVYYSLTHIFVSILVAQFFVPKYYNDESISVYVYLEKRYDSKILRYIATIIYMIQTIIYNGIVLYGPALALQQVADIPILAGTLIIMGVCVFYTFLGGLRIGFSITNILYK